jgi:hypothetical protein
MPSFSDLSGLKVFCCGKSRLECRHYLPPRAGLSIINPSAQKCGPIERSDQRMSKISLLVVVVAGVLAAPVSFGKTVTQNFASDPLQNGWQQFGNPNLFHWNSTNQNLEATWDSRESNSFFYLPLGTSLTRDDDFSIEFDLLLNDIASGIESGKTGGLEIGFGFFDFATATNPAFMRGSFGAVSNLFEFDYFPKGYFEFGGQTFEVDATTTPTFISTNSSDYAPTIFAPYIMELPTNTVVHVQMSFTAGNQTLVTLLTTNGSLLFAPPNVVLTDTNSSGFTPADNYRIDTFSITSYSSAGDDFDSVFGHGIVDNVVIAYPLPIENFTGLLTNGFWQGTLLSRSNWSYVLERTDDFQSWVSASSVVSGTGSVLLLEEPLPTGQKAFYRVRAFRP